MNMYVDVINTILNNLSCYVDLSYPLYMYSNEIYIIAHFRRWWKVRDNNNEIILVIDWYILIRTFMYNDSLCITSVLLILEFQITKI